MKISKKSTTTRWVATETARGIKVSLSTNYSGKREKFAFNGDVFFDSIEAVKKFFKGEIEYVERKVVTKTRKIISE